MSTLTIFFPCRLVLSENLYVKIPKLDLTLCIVPGSMCLRFMFENSNTKSRFLNNLSRLLVDQLEIKMGRQVVYQNIQESTLNLYKDLWLPESTRNTMYEYGIANENTRKLMSGDDSGSDSATTDGVLDKTVAECFSEFKICCGKILEDHGLFAPNRMGWDMTYTITLPRADKIMEAQSSQSVGSYKLKGIKFEYEVIRNENLASRIVEQYIGTKQLVFQDVRRERESTWLKERTDVSEELHITRESLNAIVVLFRYVDQIEDENFIFPEIETVHVSVNGKPNAIFSDGMKKQDMYTEARDFFMTTENVSAAKFFKDRFALVLDFRSNKDKGVVNSGTKVIGSSGIQIRIKKKATTKDVKCYFYVLSGAVVVINDRDFQRIEKE